LLLAECMATTPTKPTSEVEARDADAGAFDAGMSSSRLPSWPLQRSVWPPEPVYPYDRAEKQFRNSQPSARDALQALLAFSAMHQQVRQRRALASRHNGFETIPLGRDFTTHDFEASEQFVLDEVLQLVAERAIAITGADGLGIALAENNEIVLRASAGVIKPDVGARIERDSAFSGACFRTAQIIRCDDTETDDRVNLYACRQLGARSMVAVPLCGRRRVIGLLEAFSADPFGFNDSDVSSLELLAELVVGALKPEDEDRFAESAQVAEAKLGETKLAETKLAEATLAAAAIPAAVAPAVAEAPLTKSPLVAEPMVARVGDKTKTKDPSVAAITAEPLSAPDLAPQSKVEPKSITKETPVAETAQKSERAREHHPGIVLVLVLVVVSSVLAGAFWWKLKNAQLADVMVRPEPKITRPATTNLSSNVPTSITPSSPSGTNLQETTATTSERDSLAQTGNETPASPEPAKMPRITGIRHWSSADSSTVVLDLEDQVQYEAHRLTAPDRIYFDLHDTSLAPEFVGKTIEVGDSLLAKVRLAQPVAGLTRVVLETKGNSNYSVSLEPNPYRLVVQLRKLGANTKSQVSLFPEAPEAEKLAIVVPPPSREDLQLRAHVPKMRIVVDAGHGGWDLGTVGRKGLLEKDLVLEIAQRLGKLLESRMGADVILTRNDDNYIPLDERAGKANQAQADLFVSVHANYSDLPSARGVETYYTNLFSAPNSKDLETRDPERKSTNSATLSAADLHEKIEQSRRLAASVQRSLYGTLAAQNPGLRDRGVKAASYVVLTETAMPGILAEVSFVSSPTDEQKLRSDGYREQIAEALYKGIARYAAGSRGVKVASAAK
jgi:N-acetylmuramoyl-L-alanine amidase/putative methionine-R-sulfoxide reductase with GAF domain